MNTEAIIRLHEQASDRYLNGDYRGAIEAWRGVLGLDAANEQALGGVRMASQLVGSEPSGVADAPPEVAPKPEQGRKSLDGPGAKPLLQQDAVDGAIDRKPEPFGDDASDTDEFLEGYGTSATPSEEEVSFGLQPVSRP